MLRTGQLKIFFGYAAGVGKTYAMLEAAHTAKVKGIDVVIGYIEPHARPETTRLISGLESIPLLPITREHLTFTEFNLDAALTRKPKLILVDELAHTNIRGSRNLKRYQDIEELLKAGIDVYTTLNIQHLESLNDMVYQITQIVVNERIPDRIFDEAAQIEVVDLEPDELILRLLQGKVYQNTQAKRALENFFTPTNLIALREIALRRSADQITKKASHTRSTLKHDYYTHEHILICLSSSPSNAKVIRTASRMAEAFHGDFTALFVETDESKHLSPKSLAQLHTNLKLAEQLGAKIVTVYGEDIPCQIADYAQISGVSKVIIGRSANRKRLGFKQTFVERLSQIAPTLDLYIIPDQMSSSHHKVPHTLTLSHYSLKDTFKALTILSLTILLGVGFDYLGYHETNLITFYILGILLIAASTKSKGYCLSASLIGLILFNTLHYSALSPFTFCVILIAALLTNTLSKQVKEQSYQAALTAKRTEVLLETSKLLQCVTGEQELLEVIGDQLFKLFQCPIILYPVLPTQHLSVPLTFCGKHEVTSKDYLTSEEQAVALWVLKNNKNAGRTTHTLSGAKCLYLSVRGQESIYCIIGIAVPDVPLDAYSHNLLIGMLDIFSIAFENKQKKHPFTS